jgi:hypothetical protein
MKTIILAVAAAIATAGTAAAQTSDPGATTSLPSSMAPTNSPTPANKGIDTSGTSGRSTKNPSANATGAISPTTSGFPSADNPPPTGDPNSPGQKNGSGKAGGGSK